MANYFGNDNQNVGLNSFRASGIPGVNNNFQPKDGTDGMLQTSTNIFIYANGGIVGMVQSFSRSESRGVNKLAAIGYEGVVQAVPSNTNGGQLSVSRIALYNSNLWRALGLTMDGVPDPTVGSKVHATNYDDTYNTGVTNSNGTPGASLPFRTLKDQRVPLEIVVRSPMDGNAATFYEERYVDCWLASYSKSYAIGTITVAESATIQYADVF